MPKSDISKSKASSKSKDKKSESKGKDSKKTESKKSDKKDSKKDDKKKSGKSEKSEKSKSESPKKENKEKDSKSLKSAKKEDLNASTSKLDLDVDLKNNVEIDVKEEPNLQSSQVPNNQNLSVAGAGTGANFFQDNKGFNVTAGGSLVDRKKSCMMHRQVLRYYCISCDELICYDCTVMGPHNTQLHRISSIDDAFRDKFDSINKVIHYSLVPKRAQLIGQIVRLDHRLDEIKAVKNVIDKDIRDEYAAIMSRLKSAEGVKLAVLQYDISEVQKDITRIDEILMTMEEIASGERIDFQQTQGQIAVSQGQITISQGPDVYQFLHKYRQLNDNIEYAVTKHFKVEIDQLPNDLPRELAERRVLMDHYEEQRKTLKFKDDVIYKLSQELKKKYDYFQDEFDKETRNEMNEWARLVDKYGSELKKFDLICSFCGQHLSNHNVNTDCEENNQNVLRGRASASQFSINIGSDIGPLSMYFTEEEPPLDFIGKKRHYFGKASIKGINAVNQGVRNLDNNEIQLDGGVIPNSRGDLSTIPVGQIILKNPESMQALRKITQSQSNLRQRFEIQFRSLDQEQLGVIRKEDFINSVFEILNQSLSPSQILSIVQQLTSTLDDVINYEEFLKILDMAKSQYQDDFSQDGGASPHLINAMREQVQQRISQLNNYDREIIERLRSIIRNAIQQQNIELSQILFRFAQRGQDKISHDELIIAMSRVSENVQLGDIKDLFRILIGAPHGQINLAQLEDAKVQINEIVQILTL